MWCKEYIPFDGRELLPPTAAVGLVFMEVSSSKNRRADILLGERIHHASSRSVTVLAEKNLSIGSKVLVCSPVVY